MVVITCENEYGTTFTYDKKDQKIAMDLGISIKELMQLQSQIGISSDEFISAFESQTQVSPERLAELREQNARLAVQAKMFGMPETAKLHAELQSNLSKPKRETFLQRVKELFEKANGEPMPWDGEVEVMPWEDSK